MSDIKFQSFAIIQDYFNNLNQQKGRRALIHALGDNNTAIAAADILIYLVWQTFDTDQKLLETYNGYIVRTNEQIELATGCSKFINSQKHINLLIEKGFIERDFKSFRNKSRYKVNLEFVVSELDKNLAELYEKNEAYTQKQNAIKEADEKRFTASNLNFDDVNKASQDNNPTEIGKLSKDFETLYLIYTVNHYYKLYTGKTFFWNAVKFNTLMTTWRNRAVRKGSEFGLSYALFTEINNKGFGSQRPFELRVRERFNPDIQPKMFDSKEYEGVIFDNILKLVD